MPTYRFHCDACGEDFELFLPISAEDPEACPACGSRGSVKRLPLAGSGLIFKGSGFYITDNRPPDYKRAADKERSSDNGGSAKNSSAGSGKTTDS